MVAALVTVPEPVASGSKTTAIGMLAPAGTRPRLQVKVPAAIEQLPWPGVADANGTPAGSVSTTVVPVEALGPSLVAVSVNVTGLPTTAVAGLAVCVRPRSADGLTLVVTVAALSAVSGSGWLPDTVAVLTRLPAAEGVTTRVAVADAPGLSAPNAHVTVPAACAQMPCDASAE